MKPNLCEDDPGGDRSRPTLPQPVVPTTLEQLREASKPYGDRAVIQARWSAVCVWMMRQPNAGGLTHDLQAASTAILLCMEYDQTLGYPRAGKPVECRLSMLPLAVQQEALLVAADTVADWERAGSPHLIKAIERTHQYAGAVIRANPAPSPSFIA